MAQVDFVHLNEEETWLARQEFFSELDPVLAVKNSDAALREFETLFGLDRNAFGREQIEYRKLDFMARFVTEELCCFFFTSPSTATFISENMEVNREIIAIHLKGKDSVRIPEFIWKRLLKRISTFRCPQTAKQVLDFFRGYPWDFGIDAGFDQRIRDCIAQVIPNRYTQTRAGTLLLSKGEIVKNKHLRLIEAMSNTLLSRSNRLDLGHIFGLLALAGSLLGALYVYLFRTDSQVSHSSKRLSLLLTIICVHLLFSCALHRALLVSLPHSLNFVGRAPPFAFLLAWLLAEWYSLHASCAIGFFCNAVLVFALPVDPVKFILINTVILIAVLCYGERGDKKKDLLSALFCSWLFAALILIGFSLIDRKCTYESFCLELSVFSIFVILLISCAVVVFNPILESLFSVASRAALEGYLDPSNPLLQMLSIEAPGTYKHSLFVSYFSEQAALCIGANALLCKVAGLYHDVGKILSPMYFTENQQGLNIHEVFPAEESAKIIIGHVAEGVRIAQKYELPETVVDIIREHHGTGLVYYFYCKAKTIEGMKGTPEEAFRYLGPKPASKEAALVMISDCFEAASRSLDEVSEERANSLIDSIIFNLIRDHQLEECPIGLRELQLIKKALVKAFLASTHSRIKYPKRE
ncbi:HDIG domain-containing metalloprotein [Candidatus Similichlamydia laticola]|uniref:HDIG domain-containing metalloprotein n=1 Tax=Candidatus Similichlamydia laticola TaxID=2170265 RepID=UPI001C696483|nr:HDIG domain-containing metalloprotein [Candidatus Similichlamydia laticola]